MIKVNRMGEFITDELPRDRSEYDARYLRKQGKQCPVCLERISDKSTTCTKCRYEWEKIKGNPALLAEWIVEAKGNPHLESVVLWKKESPNS